MSWPLERPKPYDWTRGTGKATREGGAATLVGAVAVWAAPHVANALEVPETVAAAAVGGAVAWLLKLARNLLSEKKKLRLIR